MFFIFQWTLVSVSVPVTLPVSVELLPPLPATLTLGGPPGLGIVVLGEAFQPGEATGLVGDLRCPGEPDGEWRPREGPITWGDLIEVEEGVPAPEAAGKGGWVGPLCDSWLGDFRPAAEGEGMRGDGSWLREGDLSWWDGGIAGEVIGLTVMGRSGGCRAPRSVPLEPGFMGMWLSLEVLLMWGGHGWSGPNISGPGCCIYKPSPWLPGKELWLGNWRGPSGPGIIPLLAPPWPFCEALMREMSSGLNISPSGPPIPGPPLSFWTNSCCPRGFIFIPIFILRLPPKGESTMSLIVGPPSLPTPPIGEPIIVREPGKSIGSPREGGPPNIPELGKPGPPVFSIILGPPSPACCCCLDICCKSNLWSLRNISSRVIGRSKSPWKGWGDPPGPPGG